MGAAALTDLSNEELDRLAKAVIRRIFMGFIGVIVPILLTALMILLVLGGGGDPYLP